jgi:predicted glycosyltransferase
MASECAILGVPAIYAAHTGRGYTNEQEKRYRLVRNLHKLEWSSIESAIDTMTQTPEHVWQDARKQLLAETMDVAVFASDCIETFPAPLHAYQTQIS